MNLKPTNTKLSTLTIIICLTMGLAADGCSKSQTATVTKTVTVTNQASARPVLGKKQALSAGDALCIVSIKQITPIMNHLSQVEKSNMGKREIDLRAAPIIEDIAAEVRRTSRQLNELNTDGSVRQDIVSYASSLLELAIIEEQLSQAFREKEPARVAPITTNVTRVRAHAKYQANQFGFHVCGAISHTPLG